MDRVWQLRRPAPSTGLRDLFRGKSRLRQLSRGKWGKVSSRGMTRPRQAHGIRPVSI
jgi:hypothetical protein